MQSFFSCYSKFVIKHTYYKMLDIGTFFSPHFKKKVCGPFYSQGMISIMVLCWRKITPPLTPPTPHLSMHTFIRNVDDLHVILHTYDLFMETTPTYSLQCCLDKSCKQSYHKSWLFKVLFAQGTVYYSVLNKR